MRPRHAALATAGALAAGFAAGLTVAPHGLDARAGDLDLLLGHFWDEVDGDPDRSHWQLPSLRQAARRLQVASWLSSRHPAGTAAARPVRDR